MHAGKGIRECYGKLVECRGVDFLEQAIAPFIGALLVSQSAQAVGRMHLEQRLIALLQPMPGLRAGLSG